MQRKNVSLKNRVFLRPLGKARPSKGLDFSLVLMKALPETKTQILTIRI